VGRGNSNQSVMCERVHQWHDLVMPTTTALQMQPTEMLLAQSPHTMEHRSCTHVPHSLHPTAAAHRHRACHTQPIGTRFACAFVTCPSGAPMRCLIPCHTPADRYLQPACRQPAGHTIHALRRRPKHNSRRNIPRPGLLRAQTLSPFPASRSFLDLWLVTPGRPSTPCITLS